MNHCTGLMGRLCSCGMFHGNGGRMVDTHQHEAPRTRYHFAPGVIEGPDDSSDFLRQENCLGAIARIALPYLAALGAIALLVGRACGWI